MATFTQTIDPEIIRGNTILITGGTGFIGQHLVKTLSKCCDMIVLSRKGKLSGVTTVNIDLTNGDAVRNGLKPYPVDLVFHVAGNTITPNHRNDLDHFSVNAIGTKNLLDVCRQKDVRQIVYSSSMEVYGQAQYVPVSETHPKVPETYYGMSKLMGELYCKEYARSYGINSTILRYSYVYGPGLPEFRVISRFIRNVIEGYPLHLFDGGKKTTDFVFVKDIVTANILSVTNKNVINEEYNIGSGTSTSIEDIAKCIIKIMGTGNILYDPDEKTTPNKFIFDISKARNQMNFIPAFSLGEGLKEQINYMSA